ncbi:MAG: hypothetical protein JSU70_01550 [Phycisphaerales bacterium]|nr:MAG: hypothetical protein JSU70_01550 [Phycisphaerales bacterium]
MARDGFLRLLLIVLVAAPIGPAAFAASPISIELRPIGGVANMFNRPLSPDGKVDPIPIQIVVSSTEGRDHNLPIRITAVDMFEVPVDFKRQLLMGVPADGSQARRTVELDAGMGFFKVIATTAYGGEAISASVEIGVIPPWHPGVRKQSFFASNTSHPRTGEELRLLQALGMKVQRCHFQPEVVSGIDANDPAEVQLAFEKCDRALAESAAHDTWIMPIIAYSLNHAKQGPLKSKLAEDVGMHGPPQDFDEYVRTWEKILKHYPGLDILEFWNEPWIFGWTWADTPHRYRELQRLWCEMALAVNPNYRIIAGSSLMFVEDHIEHYPSCWRGLLRGTSNHPYSPSTHADNMRAGDILRHLDAGYLVNHRMGLLYYYITEGGTGVGSSTNANAKKLPQYFAQQALAGAYQANMQLGIGYGTGWTRPNTALAVLTHFTEDRPLVAEIWPEHELLFGAIFANPKFVTDQVRRLPRAADISTRWHVPIPQERSADETKVAVLWSNTGLSNDRLDQDGRLTVTNATGLRAFDLMGREIPAVGKKLIIPFGQYPVYISSESLSVIELRSRIRYATIESVTPVNLYALSLSRPADKKQKLSVRIENQMNCDITGTVTVKILAKTGGVLRRTTSKRFTLKGAQLGEISVPWPRVDVSLDNQYAIVLEAQTKAKGSNKSLKPVTKKQIIQVARFVKRTITVNGKLDDWKNVTPVLLDSDQTDSSQDLTEYLLNPQLERPTGDGGDSRIVARVYTAYDARYVYLAAAVNEESLANSAGKNFERKGVELPITTGAPHGLHHPSLTGDAFMFSFGFRDRVPGFGRQMDEPYAWKGHFYDTDYHYIAHVSTGGPRLVRQWGPDTPRGVAYQLDDVPDGVGPVAGARIKISRNESELLTIYEIAIPRAELHLFDEDKQLCRFGFVLCNNEGLGQNGLQWAQAAGVLDHWLSAGSFTPTWVHRLPCQTFFGIQKEKKYDAISILKSVNDGVRRGLRLFD